MPPLHFTIVEATDYRIDLVRVTKDQPREEDEEA
jgi:CBS domain containing-hemolysin-like protein